jgi:small subunit ribosomal protein S36
VWAVTALFGLLLVLHSVLTPLYRATDEARHIDQVLALREGRGYPPPGKEVLGQDVLGSYNLAGYARPGPNGIGVPDPRTDIRTPLPLLRSEAPDLGRAPSFRDVPALQRPQAQLNQMTQHPPLAYALEAAVLWAIPNDQDIAFPQVIGILRMLSVLCVLPLPLLAFNVARRLGVAEHAAVAASVVPLAIPELAHIGSSVSNDNLLTGLMSLLAVALTFVATGDLTRKTALKVGLIAGAALFTKAFALTALPWIVVAYGVALLRTRSRLAVGGTIIAGATSLVGGWWYVVNVLRYGSIQSEETLSRNYQPAPASFQASVGAYTEQFTDKVSTRFWGSFGYLEVDLPSGFTVTATIGLLALIVLGALSVKPRLAGLSLLTPLLGSLAIMIVGTYGFYKKYDLFPGLQGRYLFPALLGACVLVGCAFATLARRFAPLVALVVALGCHLYGVSVLLDKVWGGSVQTVVAWSWLPGWLTWSIMLSVVAAALAALALFAREALLPGRSDQRSGLRAGEGALA